MNTKVVYALCVVGCLSVCAYIFEGSVSPVMFFVSCAGFLATFYAVPRTRGSFVRAGIVGKDINKLDRGAPDYAEQKAKAPDVPESQGLVVGTVFLCCAVCFQPFVAPSLVCRRIVCACDVW